MVKTMKSRHTIEENLSMVVKEMFTVFIRHREEQVKAKSSWKSSPWWDGGEVKDSNNRLCIRESTWLKAAQLILRNGLNANDFVAFVVFKYKKSLPAPNWLLSREAISKFKALREQRQQDIHAELLIALKSQTVSLHDQTINVQEMALANNVRMSKAEIAAQALVSADSSMSALFRYCVAVNEDLPKIAARYADDALLQYLQDAAAYREVWKSLLPKSFVEEAALIAGR